MLVLIFGLSVMFNVYITGNGTDIVLRISWEPFIINPRCCILLECIRFLIFCSD